MLKGKLTSDIDYIWENPDILEKFGPKAIMSLLGINLKKLIKEKGGKFPDVGDTFLEIDYRFEITKSYKKEYFTDSGKSEIKFKCLGLDAEAAERSRQEWEEANKPKGEIEDGIYSQVLESEDHPKVRVSFYAQGEAVNKFFKDKEPIVSMDFVTTMFSINLGKYCKEMGRLPSPGEVLVHSSLTLVFIIKEAYFMSPSYLEIRDRDKPEDVERKKSIKWPVGLFIEPKSCEKNLDLLKSVLTSKQAQGYRNIDSNFNNLN